MYVYLLDFERIENIVATGDIAHEQSLLQQKFQKSSVGDMGRS